MINFEVFHRLINFIKFKFFCRHLIFMLILNKTEFNILFRLWIKANIIGIWWIILIIHLRDYFSWFNMIIIHFWLVDGKYMMSVFHLFIFFNIIIFMRILFLSHYFLDYWCIFLEWVFDLIKPFYQFPNCTSLLVMIGNYKAEEVKNIV